MLGAVIFFFGWVSVASAQQVTVTSPGNGTVYAPGATIEVTATASGSLLGVAAGAQGMGVSGYKTSPPYAFNLTVPSGLIGPQNIFAVGWVASEMAVLSPNVVVDIEPATPPTAINFQQSLVTFGYVGQQQRVDLKGTFSDGSHLDITGSTRIKFSSADPTKITVDSTGLMTSVGTGNTTITAAYGNLTATLQTVGPAGVKGDLNGDGLVTAQDLFLLESMVGSTPTGAGDARDLNDDGKIDNADVQALLALCAARCPTLAATTTSVLPSATHANFTQPITFTGSVTGNGGQAATGTVTFVADGQVAQVGMLGSTHQTSVVLNSLVVGTHSVTAFYNGDSNNAPSSSQPLSISVAAVVGDVNGDGVVNCLDLNLVKAAFNTRTGQPGYNAAADINHDGIVNVLDLAMVSKQILAGTACP